MPSRSKSKRNKNKSVLSAIKQPNEDDVSVLARNYFPIIQPLGRKPGVPYGLELLVDAEHLCIRKKESIDELDFCGTTDVVHFDVIDIDKGKIFYAWEIDVRGSLKIVDYASRPVLLITNRNNCCSCILRFLCCFGSTGHTVTVNQPDGSRLGQLVQKYNGWTPKFILKNEFEKPVLTIKGPSGVSCCCSCNMKSSMISSAEFPILSPMGRKVGCIMKETQDLALNGDLHITFPKDTPVEDKAVLLGSVFAINFIYFNSRATSASESLERYEEKVVEDKREQRKERERKDLASLGLNEFGKPREHHVRVAFQEPSSKPRGSVHTAQQSSKPQGNVRGSVQQPSSKPPNSVHGSVLQPSKSLDSVRGSVQQLSKPQNSVRAIQKSSKQSVTSIHHKRN